MTIAYLRRLANEQTDQRFMRFSDVAHALYDEITWRDGVPYVGETNLGEASAFYFRAVGNAYGIVGRLVRYAVANNIAVADSYLKDYVGPRTKDKMHATLAEHAIRQPEYVAFHHIDNAKGNIQEYPCVLKFAKGGRRGRGTFLLNSEQDIDKVRRLLRERHDNGERGHASLGDWSWLAQQYIPNGGDYRAITVGGACIGIVKRGAKDMERLVMGSSDHGARKFKRDRWPRSVGNLAVATAHAMRVDIAGTDIVRRSGTQELYVIELNEAPAFNVFERRTRIDVASEIVSWLRKQ